MPRTLFSSLLALVALACCAAPALASGGGITRADPAPGWTASVAGQLDWTECPQGRPCYWLPYVTAQPATPAYECGGDEAFEVGIDPNVKRSWMGTAQAANGVVAFDEPSVELLPEVTAQRLCLSAVYFNWYESPTCLAEQELDPSLVCYYSSGVAGKNFGEATVEALPPLPGDLPSDPPSFVAPVPELPAAAVSTSPPVAKRKKCGKGKRLARRGGKQVCLRIRRARAAL